MNGTFWFLVLGVFSVAFCAPSGNSDLLTVEELKGILSRLPEEERSDFVKCNIDLGYRIQQLGEQWENVEEARLAVDIFNYFLANKETINKRKLISNANLIRDTICYPEPIGCIDPDDPGIRPVFLKKEK